MIFLKKLKKTLMGKYDNIKEVLIPFEPLLSQNE